MDLLFPNAFALLPARYIIDREGIVRYAEINVDYTVRPEPESTIAALNEL